MIKSELHERDGVLTATLSGKIDQHFDGQDILVAAARNQRVVLKLDGVRSISSLGVRALEAFLRALEPHDVVLDEISAAMANQVAMIPNLIGKATVRSARLPFVCAGCGQEQTFAVPYESDAATKHAPKCSNCGATMDFDGFSEEYLPR